MFEAQFESRELAEILKALRSRQREIRDLITHNPGDTSGLELMLAFNEQVIDRCVEIMNV